MLNQEDEQSGIFNNTNPKLQLKKHYKLIQVQSSRPKTSVKPYNIFDLHDYNNKLISKIPNPEAFPLGGKRFCSASGFKQEIVNLRKEFLQDASNAKEQPTFLKYRPPKTKACIAHPQSADTSDEEYKSHSKTLASMHNNRKITTAKTNYTLPKKAATSASELSRATNKSRDLHRKYEAQYFQKLGVQGYIEYKEPLIKRYGDKYFEYTLRNRYKDQDKRSRAFLFQIGKDEKQITNDPRSFHSVAKKNGYKVIEPKYMQVVGVSKAFKQKYNSCFK